MAVELRCPECRTKLRLSQAPEPDSEIECSKCGCVFPTDDNLVHAGDADVVDRPAKKKPDVGDSQNGKSKEAEGDKKNAKKADKPFKRKKRRAKKKKTDPVMMWSIIGGAVILFGTVAGIFIWMSTRKGATQEMMS